LYISFLIYFNFFIDHKISSHTDEVGITSYNVIATSSVFCPLVKTYRTFVIRSILTFQGLFVIKLNSNSG